MSQAQENKSILRNAFERWHACKGEDAECWTSIMAPEIKFQSLARGEDGLGFTLTRNGLSEVHEYFSGLAGMFSMNHFAVTDYVAEDDMVVAVGSTSWTSRDTGREFDTPHVSVTSFKDGKMTEFSEYYDTALVARVL